MKKELNIDNIVYIVNQQQPYQNSLPLFSNIPLYTEYVQNILDYFYDEITIEEFEKGDQIIGSSCKLTEEYKGKELYDIKMIQFKHLYPNIMLKLLEKNQIKFSSPEFEEFYKFINTNKQEIFNHPDTNENTKIIIRFIINYLFGVSSSNIKRKFIIDKPNLIVDYGRRINTKIFNDYTPIHIDTDTIYIEKIDDELKQYIDSFDLPYTITENINGLFFQIKKFITENDGDIRVSGMNSTRNKNRNRPIQYEDEINDFKRNIKIRGRTKKIQKILSRGNK